MLRIKMMVRIREVLILVLSSLLIALPSEPTLACSGGTGREVDFSIDYLLDWSDSFVKAKVIASDEANQNFILEVISSQKSMPPKQLVLANTSPFSIRAYKRFGQQGCSFGGRVHDVKVGDIGYFPLR